MRFDLEFYANKCYSLSIIGCKTIKDYTVTLHRVPPRPFLCRYHVYCIWTWQIGSPSTSLSSLSLQIPLTGFSNARSWKQLKQEYYFVLVGNLECTGWKFHYDTVEIGSLGHLPSIVTFLASFPWTVRHSLLEAVRVSIAAVLFSFVFLLCTHPCHFCLSISIIGMKWVK